jgi:hypothetical protein
MIESIKDAAIIRGTGRGGAGQALAYGPHDLIYVPILVLTKDVIEANLDPSSSTRRSARLRPSMRAPQ